MRIEQLMIKSPKTWQPDDTLSEAAQRMPEQDCGCLPVMGGGGGQRLVGMLTDRNICLTAQSQGRTPKKLQEGYAMAKEVRACNPGDRLVETKVILREVRARHLPFADESERVIGVLSQSDFARQAAREHGSERHEITESGIREVLATICERRGIGGSSYE